MADQQKCCGTCRWADWNHTPFGVLNCMAPMPDSSNMPMKQWMRQDQGTTCPCYQPAPQPQPKTETEDDGN